MHHLNNQINGLNVTRAESNDYDEESDENDQINQTFDFTPEQRNLNFLS